jgi:chromosome segregation ATPase
MNNSQNNTDEIKTLLGRIRDLENTLSKYREQLDQSSKQIKGLQSILETMKNTKTSVQKQNAAVVSSNKDKVSVQEQQQQQQRRASSSTTGAKNSNSWTNVNRRTNASTNASVAKETGKEGMMRRKVPLQISDTHKQSFRKD